MNERTCVQIRDRITEQWLVWPMVREARARVCRTPRTIYWGRVSLWNRLWIPAHVGRTVNNALSRNTWLYQDNRSSNLFEYRVRSTDLWKAEKNTKEWRMQSPNWNPNKCWLLFGSVGATNIKTWSENPIKPKVSPISSSESRVTHTRIIRAEKSFFVKATKHIVLPVSFCNQPDILSCWWLSLVVVRVTGDHYMLFVKLVRSLFDICRGKRLLFWQPITALIKFSTA